MTEEDKAVCKLLVSFAKLIRQIEEEGYKEHGIEGQEESTEKMATEPMETGRVTTRPAIRNLCSTKYKEAANLKCTIKRDPEGRLDKNGS